MASFSSNTNRDFKCARCDNALTRDGPAKGGKFPGHFYLHCTLCHWHYTFPKEVSPEASQPSADPPPIASSGTKNVKTCSRKPCTKNAHGTCTRGSCRLCCVIQGGCRVSGHNLGALSATQQQKVMAVSAPTFSSQTASTSRPQPTASPPFVFDPSREVSMTAYVQRLLEEDPVHQMRIESERRAEAEKLESKREMLLERQEEEEFQQQLIETRARLLSPVSDTSDSVPPASTSHAVPAALPLPELKIAGVPVTRVTSSNRPTITTQMNATWMREFEDRTKQMPEATRRGQLDLEMVQKFRIVWWEKNDQGPVIFTVQDCPNWPKWKINDSPSTRERLSGCGPLQFYDTDHSVWIESPTSYPHSVKTDGYILLRRFDIECQDFDIQLANALRKPNNQRLYMTNVRQSLKTRQLKAKGKARARSDDSDGEVEIIAEIGSSFKTIKQEPGLEPSPSKRPRLSRLIIPTTLSTGSSSRNPITLPDSPCISSPTTAMSVDSTSSFFPLSAGSSYSPTTPPPSTLLLSAPFSTTGISMPLPGPFPLIPEAKGWPYNLYVCDMVTGLQHMVKLKKQGAGIYEERFLIVYDQQPPPERTYYDQVRKWDSAPKKLRDQAYHARRTSAGHWGRFASTVRASKAV